MSILTIVLLVLALVFFLLAAFNVPKVNWIAVGLVCVVLSWLVPAL